MENLLLTSTQDWFAFVANNQKNTGNFMSIFLIAFVIIFLVGIISVVLGVVFKYKESKAVRDAALLRAEADAKSAKLRATAEVQQAVVRDKDRLETGLLRAALGKMKPEDAINLIQGLQKDAQSIGAQSVQQFNQASTDEAELDSLINDLMSGIDANQEI